MNMSKLAIKMLEWEELQRKITTLEIQIGEAVLFLGKSVTVGNIRATYSKGRRKYDYETPGKEKGTKVVIGNNTKTVVDWRQVCKDDFIDPLVIEEGEPYVRMKLLPQ